MELKEEKMKKLIKKEKIFNIFIFILMLLTCISIILLKRLDDLDELWNYNFARNISMGLVPYRDFSMIVTPLFSFLGGFILKITTNQLLIIWRICAAIFITAILYVIYKIFNLLDIKKEVNIIYLAIIFLLFQNIISFDYNWASLFIVLTILYNELKYYKKNNKIFEINIKKDMIIGILAGMAVMCKQTVGILIAFTFLMNKIIFIRNKEEFKVFLKIFAHRLIGVLFPIILCFIYLVVNNALYDFISYTIKGTREFSNFYSYINLIGFDAVGFIAVVLPIILIVEVILLILKKRDKTNYYLLVYSISMLILIFPISDAFHFVVGATPAVILLLLEIYNLLFDVFKKNTKLIKGICVFISTTIILSCVLYSINNFYKYTKSKNNFSNIKMYQNIIIDKETEKMNNQVSDYISNSEKDVKVLEASAVLFMMPIGRYNKDYDMFNKGNFGENGENRLIEDIKNSNNRQYLILKENCTPNWQTPTKIIEYIKNNKKEKGEVSIYNIYE